MTPEHLLPLIGFVAVMSGTPGPNNLMLMAAGANVGWRPCLPHLLGIAFGCQALLWSLALGLGGLLAHYPALNWGLRLIGAAFLLTLAWRLATTRARPGEQRAARPLTFSQAALFHRGRRQAGETDHIADGVDGGHRSLEERVNF